MYPPFLPIIVSSLVHHASRPTSKPFYLVADVLVAVVLWRYPPGSILALWRWAILAVRQLTKIPSIDSVVPKFLVNGGPLGPGCGKVVEVVTGCLLWRLAYPNESIPIALGPLPSLVTWVIVLALCGLTNLVLSFWSRRTQSRGDHSGVHNMVESSRGRTLSSREHLHLLAWAIANATCEEVASRGMWMHEFTRRGKLSFLHANLLQAVSFGVWHFHGIPSGWIGVGLTFVYGLAMGFMLEYGGGLLLPIVAHSIADYFIFAVIARQGGFT